MYVFIIILDFASAKYFFQTSARFDTKIVEFFIVMFNNLFILIELQRFTLVIYQKNPLCYWKKGIQNNIKPQLLSLLIFFPWC